MKKKKKAAPKKAAPKKKASQKKVTPPKTKPKKAAPKKAALVRAQAATIANSLALIKARVAGLDSGQPVCKTEKKNLGGCMDIDAAIKELKKHLQEFPNHDVDAVNC